MPRRTFVPGARLALQRQEAADALGIGVDTFDRHVKPHLRVVRVGTVRLYPVEELDRWLAEQAASPMGDLERGAA
jgi:excisionase family DNA binding protein